VPDCQNQTEGAVVLRDEAVNFELCRDHTTHLSPALGLRLLFYLDLDVEECSVAQSQACVRIV